MKTDMLKVVGKEAKDLLARACSHDYHIATAAQVEMVKAFENPIQQAVLNGPILDNIFDIQPMEPGKPLKYSTDLTTQGTVKNHVAYNLATTGAVPDRYVNADYLKIDSFLVGNSIDCSYELLEVGNFDVIRRLLEILSFGFTQKMNNDGWRLLIKAANDRGVRVTDPAAAQGFFTKRLARTLKTQMVRLGGGNSASAFGLRTLTDIYMSLEAHDAMLSWDLTQVDDATRRVIYLDPEGESTIFGVKLHPIFEFGVGQAYTNYWLNTLGATSTAGKNEFMVGLSLKNRNSFVMAMEKPTEVFEDPTYHRQRKLSMYGWTRYGMGVLDNRPILLAEI